MLLSRVFPELWKFGTHERAARDTPLALVAQVSGDAAAQRCTSLRRSGTTTGYQVTAGRTLVITRVHYSSPTAGTFLGFLYGDADAGKSLVAEPAVPVYLDTDAAQGNTLLVVAVASTVYTVDYYFEVPAAKFLHVWIPAGASVRNVVAYGHEV